ncbi:hypothetical protein [Nocardia sp. NPDC050710]|uniref:hypothetical protein n=1 Tax=Nocardia sp. NPDC050710 TaxID=3157220 RepID=UPI0033C3E067
MGTWGVVCAFDAERFRTAVVPALRSGPDHPIVAGAIRRWRAHSLIALSAEIPGDFEGLAEVMTHVDDSFSDCDLGRRFHVVNGEIRTRSEPPNLFDYDGSIWCSDDFVDLVEWIITRETLRACARLGSRGSRVSSVFDEYRGQQYAPVTELDTLLARLDYGAAYLIDRTGGEGIHGWLDAAETRRLASLMPPKPRGDISELSTTDWMQVQLWAVLDWAIDHDLGLLWGGDLRVLYENHPEVVFFDDGATLPIWLEGDTDPDHRDGDDESPEPRPTADL